MSDDGRRPLALVVNPAATVATSALRAQVLRALRPRGLQWSLVTRGSGDAAALAARAVEEGAAVVVALGGDGTASEVAGALAGGPAAAAILPGGNANVFARAQGWPRQPDQALAALERALERGAVRELRLGLLTLEGRQRVVAINAGVGLDAAVVEWIEARPQVKRRLRQVGYSIGTGLAAGRARGQGALEVEVDGRRVGPAAALLAACGRPYTYLGSRPLDLVPGASLEGTLAWLGLRRVRLGELGALMAEAARGRPLPLEDPSLASGTVARRLVVTSAEPAPVQADGEALGRHRRAAIAPGPTLRALDPRA